MREHLQAVGRSFGLRGRLVSGERLGKGHIHATFLVTYDVGGTTARWVHQRLNTEVFREPAAVMENVARVLEHLGLKLAPRGPAEAGRRTLSLFPAPDGRPFVVDDDGDWWRTYAYIDGTRTLDAVATESEAFQAARAFGEFQLLLADLPPPPLAETIPSFHDTPTRLRALEVAAASDPLGRIGAVREELRFVEKHRDLAGRLEELHRRGVVTSRTVHNDTKVSNLLFDAATGEALCVLDLDTVMPGLALHDFGDLARSAVAAVPEDEPRPDRVAVRPGIFVALARGWTEALGDLVTAEERSCLVTAARVLALELGARFLTDFLEGDRVFRPERPFHNLDRCRTQLALVRDLGEKEEALLRLAGIGP